MDARFFRAMLLVAITCSMGAAYRTTNFVVHAPLPQLAKEIGDEAERFRKELSFEWLGKELPRWSQPCPINVKVAPHLGAGGATSFMFDHGRPFGWQMNIQGSRQRVLDSVLPHEVTHTIFATHFGQPLPRWADEGACTTVEHASEKQKQQNLLIRFLTWQNHRGVPRSRGIAFNNMFAMKDYPRDILPLYAQGYSVARFLIGLGGKQRFVQYLGEGMSNNRWSSATKKFYGFGDLGELQQTWLDWVGRGSPMQPAGSESEGVRIASTAHPSAQTGNGPVYRAQNSKSVKLSERLGLGRRRRVTDDRLTGRASPQVQESSELSWYVRQNTRAKKQRGQQATAKSRETIYAAGSPRAPAATGQNQPPAREQRRRVILEWSHPDRALFSDSRRLPVRFDAPPVLRGTVWR
jgi:hypothetical protein